MYLGTTRQKDTNKIYIWDCYRRVPS